MASHVHSRHQPGRRHGPQHGFPHHRPDAQPHTRTGGSPTGVQHYGVFIGTMLEAKSDGGAPEQHLEVQLDADGTPFRIAVNVRSADLNSPPDLLFRVIEDFRHPVLDAIRDLPAGFTSSVGDGAHRAPALDYIRGNLFDPSQMRVLPSDLSAHSPLSDLIAKQLERAKTEPGARVYAFGSRWGPEQGKPDQYFGFEPGDGIHNIHMNQGNPHSSGRTDFFHENGVWQDGGLFLHFPSIDQWVAVFLAFQSQAWHTDDQTGAPLVEQVRQPAVTGGEAVHLHPSGPARSIRLIGVRFEPPAIMLLNTTPTPVDLHGWRIADIDEHGFGLSDGSLGPGEARSFALPPGKQLPGSGGIITLLNPDGLKVDGASYTQADIQHPTWIHVFG